jgi:hypothetical protein
LLRERALNSWDLALVNALVKHYEVYLWPGSDKALPTEPLSSPDEFWEKLPSIISASAQAVAEGLATQGFSTEGYRILDHLAYESLSEKCQCLASDSGDPKNSATLDHSQLKGTALEDIITAVDTTQINKVITLKPTAEELDAFLQFPNLKMITFTGTWSESYLPQLAGHDIHLQIESNESSQKISIPTTFKKVSLKNVTISPLAFGSPHSNEGNLLEDLNLHNCPTTGNLDLQNFSKLKKLKLKGKLDFTIRFSMFPDLESLKINGSLRLLELETCKKLKNLT